VPPAAAAARAADTARALPPAGPPAPAARKKIFPKLCGRELPTALMRALFLAALSAARFAASAAPLCSPLRYCPANCSRAGAVETDGLALLDAHFALLGSVGAAVDVARTFPGVLTDDRLDIHLTFEYLCCVTRDEIVAKVFPALDAVQWAPVDVSFSEAICNVDGSIILAADAPSQAALGAVVARFEAAVEAAGVAVVPRAQMQGFHVTIATTNATYPMAAALAAINAKVPRGAWSPAFALKNFAFLLPVPHEVVATQ